ncbi:MAG: hypothetical protein ACTSQA_01110 [Candidatus Heimdallarchaeaceae archaeon]
MNRVLVIDNCFECRTKGTYSRNKKVISCSNPNFKGESDEIYNEMKIHKDCPLPSGDYIVSKKDKEWFISNYILLSECSPEDEKQIKKDLEKIFQSIQEVEE